MDSAGDLDITMLRYNLLEHSDNYYMTSGNLWNYHRDEISDKASENNVFIIRQRTTNQ